MKCRSVGLSLTLIFACLALSGCVTRSAGPVPASAPPGRWTLLADYSDEFDSPSLDLEKWDNDVQDWGVWSWAPENAWVGDGRLHLRMKYHKHERGKQTLFYTSGIIKSRAAPVQYGYFEARIKAAPLFPGVCPAFWAYRSEAGLWTEIDFVELTEQPRDVKLMDTNTHVFNHPKLPKGKTVHEHRSYLAPWDPRDDFHIYGCLWNEKEIKWYLDGVEIAARENEYWHQPLDVVLSFGVRWPLKETPSTDGFPTVFEVDYVRVWTSATPGGPSAD